MKTTFATNLSRARRAARVTMEELANLTNCSKQAISHYENGIRYPDSKTIRSLASALDVDIDYFFSTHKVEFSLSYIRYREGDYLSETQKTEVENITSCRLHDYLELEEIASDYIDFENPLSNLQVSDTKDAEKAAKQLRKKWKLGEGPIYNLSNLLEKNGVKVIKIDFGFTYNHEGLSGWTGNNEIPVIVLNARQQDVTRIRFTILHELGHLLLEISDSIDSEKIERICDAFAGAVLLPYDILVKEFGQNRSAITMLELRRIKELYGISVTAIMVRARFTNLINRGAYEKWKSSEFWDLNSGQYQGTEAPQRFEQMLYRCLSEKKIGFDKASLLSKVPESELRQAVYNKLTF